jgi:hypothetical protein
VRTVLLIEPIGIRFALREHKPEIQARLEGMPKAIIGRAWEAQVRLCWRFRRLTARGKPINITVLAIARELAGFI